MFALDLFNFSTPSHLENRSIKMSTRKGHRVRGDDSQIRVFYCQALCTMTWIFVLVFYNYVGFYLIVYTLLTIWLSHSDTANTPKFHSYRLHFYK